jgi:hypothetical protein
MIPNGKAHAEKRPVFEGKQNFLLRNRGEYAIFSTAALPDE